MCRCFIITLEYTVIVDGTVRVNCGECGKYQYHLVDGDVKYLKRDPVIVNQARYAKKPVAKRPRADLLKQQEQLALKQLEAIRREIEKFHAESSS